MEHLDNVNKESTQNIQNKEEKRSLTYFVLPFAVRSHLCDRTAKILFYIRQASLSVDILGQKCYNLKRRD